MRRHETLTTANKVCHFLVIPYLSWFCLAKSGLSFLAAKWKRIAETVKSPKPAIWVLTPTRPRVLPRLSLSFALGSVGSVPAMKMAATSCRMREITSKPTKRRVMKRALSG